MMTRLCERDLQDLPGGDITMHERTSVVESLKLRKAPYYDSITNKYTKHRGDTVKKCTIKLFNAIFRIGKILTVSKQGLIIHIYKGEGKPRVTYQWPCCHASIRP